MLASGGEPTHVGGEPTHVATGDLAIIDLTDVCPNRPLSDAEAAVSEDSIFDTCKDLRPSKRRRTNSPQASASATPCTAGRAEHNPEQACALQTQDSFCGVFIDPPAHSAPLEDETFDSQLTANDDPMKESQIPPVLLATSTPVHFSDDDHFWNAVAEHDFAAQQYSWYDSAWFWDAPSKFDEALPAASAFISNFICCRWDEFKIGITENIVRRWRDRGMGYQWRGWDRMFLLYAAPTSKTRESVLDSDEQKQLKRESTGAFETALIAEWGEHSFCLNQEGAGGECPSAGWPHFVYVVVR